MFKLQTDMKCFQRTWKRVNLEPFPIGRKQPGRERRERKRERGKGEYHARAPPSPDGGRGRKADGKKKRTSVRREDPEREGVCTRRSSAFR